MTLSQLPFSVMSTVDVRMIQSAAAPSRRAERLAGAPATLDHPRDDSSGVKPCFSLAKLVSVAEPRNDYLSEAFAMT